MTDPNTATLARIRQMVDAWEQRFPETIRTAAVVDALRMALEPVAVEPTVDRTAGELASLAVNAATALRDERRHYEIACQENAQLRATIERVRRLHDALDEETALTSPDDEITRGAAARKIAAALDGWTDPAELRRMADETATAPCGECSHPQAVHGEGDDPVSPGRCASCPDDDAWHNYQPATRARMADETATTEAWQREWDSRPDGADVSDLFEITAVVPCSGTLFSAHQPHTWEPQPGMAAVHCPGERQPAVGTRQDGATS